MKIAKFVLRFVDHNISLITLGLVICIRFREANRLTFRRLEGFQHFFILYQQKLHLSERNLLKPHTSNFREYWLTAIKSYRSFSKMSTIRVYQN